MKNLFLSICTISLLCFYSCGGSGSSSKQPTLKASEVDYLMLSNPEGLKKAYDIAIAKLDTNIKYVDEVEMRINLDTQDDINSEASLGVTVIQLNNQNRNKLTKYRYYSSQGKWGSGETMTVDLIGGGDADSFVLADVMFDLTELTFEKLNKIVQDGLAKYYDKEKYNYMYVYSVTINENYSDKEPKVHVYMAGQLKSNEIIKKESIDIPLRKAIQ